MRHTVLTAVFVIATSATAGCESKKEEKAESAAAAPTPTPTPTPTPAATPDEPEEKKRPAKIETEVTDERRSKVEEALPETKGFVVMADIEDSLKKNKGIDQKAAAVAAFDQRAKGKWVLFTGPLVNLTDEGFDLGITYTPRQPDDPMGMSRQWFPVTLTEIEGYEKDEFKPGQMVVVVAKYNGQQKAGPGHELVEAEHWE